MKLLNTKGQIMKGKFACKVNTVDEIREHWSQVENNDERFKIVELAIMTNEEYDEFKNDLLDDWDFLEGKGGTDSTTFPESAKDKENFFELTEEERNEFRRGAYRECIGVTTAEANEMIVVDPQGYSYARYSTIIEG